jgi:hypothetical protein
VKKCINFNRVIENNAFENSVVFEDLIFFFQKMIIYLSWVQLTNKLKRFFFISYCVYFCLFLDFIQSIMSRLLSNSKTLISSLKHILYSLAYFQNSLGSIEIMSEFWPKIISNSTQNICLLWCQFYWLIYS